MSKRVSWSTTQNKRKHREKSGERLAECSFKTSAPHERQSWRLKRPINSPSCGRCLRVFDLHTYEDEKARALGLWASRLRHVVNGTKAQKVVRLRGHE